MCFLFASVEIMYPIPLIIILICQPLDCGHELGSTEWKRLVASRLEIAPRVRHNSHRNIQTPSPKISDTMVGFSDIVCNTRLCHAKYLELRALLHTE